MVGAAQLECLALLPRSDTRASLPWGEQASQLLNALRSSLSLSWGARVGPARKYVSQPQAPSPLPLATDLWVQTRSCVSPKPRALYRPVGVNQVEGRGMGEDLGVARWADLLRLDEPPLRRRHSSD